MLLTSYPTFTKPILINIALFYNHNSNIFLMLFLFFLFFFFSPLLEIHNTHYSLHNQSFESSALREGYYYILSSIYILSILFQYRLYFILINPRTKPYSSYLFYRALNNNPEYVQQYSIIRSILLYLRMLATIYYFSL